MLTVFLHLEYSRWLCRARVPNPTGPQPVRNPGHTAGGSPLPSLPPDHPPQPHTHIRGKTVFHETGPWGQKGRGLLVQKDSFISEALTEFNLPSGEHSVFFTLVKILLQSHFENTYYIYVYKLIWIHTYGYVHMQIYEYTQSSLMILRVNVKENTSDMHSFIQQTFIAYLIIS